MRRIAGFEPGRLLLAFGMGWYGFLNLQNPQRGLFMDNVNLIIHEAGHVIFRVFGEFVYFLGGSLMQILVPLVFSAYFWRSGQRFAACVTIFWTATSLLQLAVYVGDARAMELPLLGGEYVTHDWNWILTELGWLRLDKALAGMVYATGFLYTIVGVLGAAYFARGDTLELPWHRQRTNPDTPVSNLCNLGQKSAAMLEKVGIRTREELEEIGAIEAYKKLKLAGETPGHSLVYAIEGALINRPWDALPTETRFRLKAMIEHADTVLEARGIARPKMGEVE